MHRPIRSLAALVGLGLFAAACGEDAPGTPGQAPPPTGAEMTIVGQDTAFDLTDLEATVDEPLTITFDNRDDGLQHNLHVRDTAEGDAMTDITEGPDTQTLTVTFDQPGEFAYLCDVHPDEMNGTITVSG